jgi:hypothetical protein
LKLPAQLPEPGRFWIRYTLACGLAPELWTDLAQGTLGRPLPLSLADRPLDDVVYLPPVLSEAAGHRDRQALRLLAAGTPVLLQLLPGEESPAAAAGAILVFDLLEPLLRQELAPLGGLPPGAAAVWPLVAGLTADPGLWEEGCRRLAESGPRTVQALRLQLAPEARRRLVDRAGEGVFEALFHGEPPAERGFARAAHGFGIAPFLPRPLPRPPFQASGIENRRLAGLLALAAELWLRLGRPEEPGQALFRAARGADQTAYDLRGLARDGHLAVLSWLDGASRSLLEEALRGDPPALLAGLLAEYLDGEGGGSDER